MCGVGREGWGEVRRVSGGGRMRGRFQLGGLGLWIGWAGVGLCDGVGLAWQLQGMIA